jgi:hypothetical protein
MQAYQTFAESSPRERAKTAFHLEKYIAPFIVATLCRRAGYVRMYLDEATFDAMKLSLAYRSTCTIRSPCRRLST